MFVILFFTVLFTLRKTCLLVCLRTVYCKALKFGTKNSSMHRWSVYAFTKNISCLYCIHHFNLYWIRGLILWLKIGNTDIVRNSYHVCDSAVVWRGDTDIHPKGLCPVPIQGLGMEKGACVYEGTCHHKLQEWQGKTNLLKALKIWKYFHRNITM